MSHGSMPLKETINRFGRKDNFNTHPMEREA